MIKALRFVCASALLVWLGVTIGITFYVAPSLFSNRSGQVPDSSVAGEIIAPMLGQMNMTAWAAISAALVCLVALSRLLKPDPGPGLAAALALLTVALLLSIYAGGPAHRELHDLRLAMKGQFGGYHRAPDTHPHRIKFAKLHGITMVITLVNLGLGAGAFFCVTQLVGEPRRPASDAPKP